MSEQRFLDEHGLELFWDEKVKRYTDTGISEYDATLAEVAKTGEYDDLVGKPSIPTATSDLENDSGFITDVTVNGESVVEDGVADIVLDTELDYTRLLNKPTITEPDFHTVTIEGDKTFDDYGMRALDALDIIGILS